MKELFGYMKNTPKPVVIRLVVLSPVVLIFVGFGNLWEWWHFGPSQAVLDFFDINHGWLSNSLRKIITWEWKR